MNKKVENIENILNNKKLKIGNLIVEMNYSNSNKKIDEYILNILKQKSEKC